MIATSRRRKFTIVVGLLIAAGLFWRWWTHEPAPEWQFDCGGEMPVVAVSADGQLLAVGASTFGDPNMREIGVDPRSACDGGLVQIWRLADRKLLASCKTDAVVKSLTFTSDESRILAAMNKWNPGPGKPWYGRLLTWRFRGDEKPVEVVLPDSVEFATVSTNDKLVAAALGAYDEGPSKLIVVSFEVLLKGALEPVDSPPAMAVDDVGERTHYLQKICLVVRAVANKESGTDAFEVWATARRKREVLVNPGFGGQSNAAVSPDEKAMAVDSDSGLTFIDLQTGQASHPLAKRGLTIRYHPHGTLIAIGGGWKSRFPGMIKGGFWLYELPSWKLAGAVQFSDWNTAVRSITFTPDGESLITARDNGIIQLWSLKGLGLAVRDKD